MKKLLLFTAALLLTSVASASVSTKPIDIILKTYQPSLDFYSVSLTYSF